MMKPKTLLIICITVYVGCFLYSVIRSLNLEFNGELIALLPADNPHLDSYKRLEQLNSSEGGFNLIIEAEDGRPVIERARSVTGELLGLELNGEPVFRNAELENDLYDIKKSALYLMTEDELDRLYEEVDEYITAKKNEANPLYLELDDSEEAELDVGTNASVLLEEVANSRRYMINEDSTVISVFFLPAFPKSDFNTVESTYLKLLEEKERIEREYSGLNLYWGGSYVNHYDKINDIQYSVTKALVIGILSLLIFLVAYMIFINRKAAYKARYILLDLLLIFFVLFSGFAISLGIASFLFHEINVFTGIIFSILFGINLDYILHLYAVNKQRALDTTSASAVIRSYLRTTRPILLSCLTTGLAIMSLIFADFNGFIQFGIIFFINIVVNLLSTYLFLLLSPANAKAEADTDDRMKEREAALAHLNRKARMFAVPALILVISVGAFLGAQSLSFNFSFSDLEPVSKSSSYKEMTAAVSTGSSYHEPSYFITGSIEESKALFEEIDEGIGEKYKDIERVESFSARYPAGEEEFEAKTDKVEALRSLISSNDEFLRGVDEDAREFIDIVMSTVRPTINGLPKYIRNRFFFKDGSIAPLVIMYPAMSLSNGETSIQFRKSSGAISINSGETFYAASTTIIASSILELLIKESTFLFVVPLLTIMLLLLLYYRSFLNAILAALPLLLTFGAMLGIRALIPFDINLYNVIVFPIVIGVGADNGIHMVDVLINKRPVFMQYFISGKFPVLAACSFTTILGFIGLLFIDHPGMESIGILAITGITVTLAATFLSSLLIQTFVLQR